MSNESNETPRNGVKCVSHVFYGGFEHLNFQFIKGLVESRWCISKFYLFSGLTPLVVTEDIVAKYEVLGVNVKDFQRNFTGSGKLFRYLVTFHCYVFPFLPFLRIVKFIISGDVFIFHGGLPAFGLALILKLCGKEVYFISWGGKPRIEDKVGLVTKITYRILSRVFVLMSPELQYYKGVVNADKLAVCPYFTNTSISELSCNHNSRVLILGNSTWLRDLYPEILDQLIVSDWDRIIVMLNYGDLEHIHETEEFIRKYKEKFGCIFCPWTTTDTLEEYNKVMGDGEFFISPIKTQQGLGAIFTSCVMGKTVILCGDNYIWMKKNGMIVFDLDSLPDLTKTTLNKLILTDTQILHNRAVWKRYQEMTSIDNWYNCILNNKQLFD